ncbi:MAG: SUMF1/EgtB/PvdO family nonheme iron enzyme [Planctomycetes bacterium]|nr:SUMF1/EgtB/PvdO family nonheme iron enzyme [Planctomycetota bacterium]
MLKNGIIAAIVCILGLTSDTDAEMTYFAHKGQISTIALMGTGKKAKGGTTDRIYSMADKNFGGSWNIEFSGIMDVTGRGKYDLVLSSDDGSALFIDGKLIVMNDGPHGIVSRTSTVNLAAGKHQVNLLYFNQGGGHGLTATVRAAHGTAQDLASVCSPSRKRQNMVAFREQALKATAKQREADRTRRAAAEQKVLADMSDPEALVRSIKHILKTKPREYKNGRSFLKQAQQFQETMPEILKKQAEGDPEAVKAMKAFGKLRHSALLLENPYIDFDEILVVLTDQRAKKANWLGTHVMRPKGYNNKIARVNLRTGKVSDVFEPEDGAYVGELDLHYDGQKMLFSSTDKNNMYQVMEVGIDGATPRRVSTIMGDYVHNYGGIYLPNEKIVFSSTAPMIGVPCIGGGQSVPNLYLMGPNGEDTRQLTFEQDADWYPTVTADGKIMYLRWEYTDIMHYYSRIMMTMNPDGTNQRAIYGSQSLWPNSMFYARPLPGEPGMYSAVVSGHHGVAGTGKLTIFDTNKGFAHADGVVQYIPGYGKQVTHVTVDQVYPTVKKDLLKKFPDLQTVVTKLINDHMPESSTRGKDYHECNNDFFNKCYARLRDYYPDEMALDLDQLANGVYPQFDQPYPVSAEYHLTVAQLSSSSDWGLYLVDTFDNFVPIKIADAANYRYMVEPYPLRKRERPPIIPDRVNLFDKEATCYIQNIYRGPGLKGIPDGTVDSLRLFTYAYGYYKVGNHHHLGVESGWDVKRLLGTVKVEKDGSVMFKIPANTTISIQPLDKEGRALQLFRSWLVAMPGEELSCVGCHESPSEPPVANKTMASGRAPQRMTPYRNRVEGFSFNAEVQPILDAYCVRCHDGTDKKPNFKNKEIKNPSRLSANYSDSYYAFHRYFRRPGPESNGTMSVPYEFHASTSEGVQLLEKGHHGVNLDEDSWRRLYTWIDLNVPFYGSWSTAYSENDGHRQRTAEMSAKAAALRSKYALVDSNWEYTPSTSYAVSLNQEKGLEKSDPVSVSARNWPFDAATAKQLQEQTGVTQKKVVDLGNGLAITMVRIPAGEFVMGSDEDTPQEQPRHKIKIDRAFWISENEINNELFFAFKPGHNASIFDQQWKDHVRLGYYASYDEQPAVRMSWQDAVDFCAWVGKKTGQTAALPTEAQWEWVCRAGSDKAMAFGSKESDFSTHANLADKSIAKFAVSGVNPTFRQNLVGNPTHDYIPRIAEFDDKQFLITGTKQYQPNAWGVYDMHGNVAEWTRSDYVSYPYTPGKSDSMNASAKKVVRGGSFFDRPYRATSSYRLGYVPWQGVYNVGFRVVIEEQEGSQHVAQNTGK